MSNLTLWHRKLISNYLWSFKSQTQNNIHNNLLQLVTVHCRLRVSLINSQYLCPHRVNNDVIIVWYSHMRFLARGKLQLGLTIVAKWLQGIITIAICRQWVLDRRRILMTRHWWRGEKDGLLTPRSIGVNRGQSGRRSLRLSRNCCEFATSALTMFYSDADRSFWANYYVRRQK